MKSRLHFLLVLLLVFSTAVAQPQLSVSIRIPAITINSNGESYSPMPVPVEATIYNNGSTASGALSARISFTDDLRLDVSEQDAMIKTPVPTTILAGDSAKIEWLLTHQPSFTAKNYRVHIWLLEAGIDSFMTQKLFILPAISPPDLRMTLGSVFPLHVRPDSLGYEDNPFTITLRLANQGGSTIDSVSVKLLLPDDYILEPSTQANPYNIPLPMPPPSTVAPRVDIQWTIRYYGATIRPRSDTFRIMAGGIDINGGWRQKDTIFVIDVDGVSPAIGCTFQGPASLQYDAATIYSPQPFRLIADIMNIGEQWAQLQSTSASVDGEGVELLDAAVKPAGPSLLPGSGAVYTWDIAVERRPSPRRFTVTVEITDLDGRRRVAEQIIQVPGKPYNLTVENLTAVDTLPLNAEETHFISPDISIRYSIANRTWYNSTVEYIKTQSLGTGIEAPPFHEHQPMIVLAPDDVGNLHSDTFTVTPDVNDRVISFQILAVSDRKDTATAEHSVLVPGLRPVLVLDRNGPNALYYDKVNTYTPNPFYQEYILRNTGHVTVRVDSLRLEYNAEGVSTHEPLLRPIGWNLKPGDSLVTRWNFLAEKRDTDRKLDFTVNAWTTGEQELAIAHTLTVPGLYPVPQLSFSGDDTLSFDPVHVYTPNPFTRRLTIRNIGTDDLRCDSVLISVTDNYVVLDGNPKWSKGATVNIDSSLELSWRFIALERSEAISLPITATLYHERGSEMIRGDVFIPALRPGLEISFSGDSFLTMDSEEVYTPNPFTKTVQITNNGTGTLYLDSVRLKSTDPDIYYDENRMQHIDQELQPGHSVSVAWHGRCAPRFMAGNVLLEFDIYHSAGEVLPTATDLSIPGKANYFNVADISAPAELVLDQNGEKYQSDGFSIRFRAQNICWAKAMFSKATISTDVQDGIGRHGTGSIIQPNELLPPNGLSQIVSDSFVVSPRPYERFLTADITIQDGFGRTGTAAISLLIPAIVPTSVAEATQHSHFHIASLFPMPIRTGTSSAFSVLLNGIFSDAVTLELSDLLGRVILRRSYSSGNGTAMLRFETGTVASGIYVLRALNGPRMAMRLVQLQ